MTTERAALIATSTAAVCLLLLTVFRSGQDDTWLNLLDRYKAIVESQQRTIAKLMEPKGIEPLSTMPYDLTGSGSLTGFGPETRVEGKPVSSGSCRWAVPDEACGQIVCDGDPQ